VRPYGVTESRTSIDIPARAERAAQVAKAGIS